MKKYGMDKYKTIGIIGGQGPASTIAFYERIVAYFQDEFGARYVRDYPPMIICSVPTPDLVAGVENEEKTYKLMANAIYGLEREGAEFIIITCISLQYFIERLQPLVRIPIIPISPILAEDVERQGYKTVGVLGTATTIEKRICHPSIEEKGIKLVVPNKPDQNRVGEVVLNVIGGRAGVNDTEILKEVIGRLGEKGAEAILLACTELPMVLKQSEVNLPMIDCNELYPKVVAEYSSGRMKLPYK